METNCIKSGLSFEEMKYHEVRHDIEIKTEGIEEDSHIHTTPASTFGKVDNREFELSDTCTIYRPECTFIFDQETASHMSSFTLEAGEVHRVENIQETSYQCLTAPTCMSSYVQESSELTAPISSNVGKVLFCCECKISYATRNTYLRHMLQFHSYTCECCNKQFLSKLKLKKHMKLQQIIVKPVKKRRIVFRSRKPKENPVPKRSRKTKSAKRTELKKSKSDGKSLHVSKGYPCDSCPQIFLTKETCRQHKSKVHWKANKCSMCGKVLSSQATLQYHMRGHMGLRPFACEQCDQRFTSNNVLKKHVMYCHSS